MTPHTQILVLSIASLVLGAPAQAAAPRDAKAPSSRSSRVQSRIPTIDTRASTRLPQPPRVAEAVRYEVRPCEPAGSRLGGFGSPEERALLPCGPDSGLDFDAPAVPTGPSGDGSGTAPQPDAFDLFPPYHNGLSSVRSYLMTVAAFYIYEPLDYEGDDFPDFLADTMEGYGLETRFFEAPLTDTQAAVMWNDDVVILSLRGTTPGLDMYTDLQHHFRNMPASWGEDVLVHDGFAGAWENIREDVVDEIEDRLVGGRRLWITGHSLGGALATLAAYDLSHVEDIPVEGVHTFGQPRVGDAAFEDHFLDEGLLPRFYRWQMEGDPVPTFFDDGLYVACDEFNIDIDLENLDAEVEIDCGIDRSYHHVGRVNDILVSGPNGSFDYQLDPDADDHELWWHAGGAEIEHVKYDDALWQWIEASEKPAMLEILPPVAVDPDPSGFLP